MPSHTMNTGPRLTFGTLLSTTKYGSSTRAQNGHHHSSEATATPSSVAMPKPSSVR